MKVTIVNLKQRVDYFITDVGFKCLAGHYHMVWLYQPRQVINT